MTEPEEIHRASEVTRLARVIESPTEGLSICGVSGPGGVGKSFLLRHVLDAVRPASLGYLTLTVNGQNPQSRGDFFGLLESQWMPRSLGAPARPRHDYFPHLREVAGEHRALLDEAARELSGAPPDVKAAVVALLRAGHALNKAAPKTRRYLDVAAAGVSDHAVRDALDAAWDAARNLSALRESRALWGPLRDALGVTLRNRVRHELYNATADAIRTDLAAAVGGYRSDDRWRFTQRRIEGVSRVLLVVDDFEAIAPVLEEFLVGALIPKLAESPLQTVLVVLGRDDLDAMHPGWDQGCRRYRRDQIRLAPFDRAAAFDLMERAGVAPERREALFESTQGFPFLLHLLVEEQAEGDSALFLRKFFDRTTKWMTDEERGWFLRVCYLDAVNEDTLARLFTPDEVPRVQDWFEREASIRDPSAALFRVRPLIREKVLRYQELRAPTRHRELTALAAG